MNLSNWKITSPSEKGFFEVVAPGKNDCRALYFYRLNLNRGDKFTLNSGKQELNTALIRGRADLKSEYFNESMVKLDSFYLPGNSEAKLTAVEDCTFYIGGAICEGKGSPFFREFQKDLPLGEIRQIHGQGPGEREVFMTLNPEAPASRLICGYTWGKPGGWTSWPPHQHEKHLEEIYCYFDMPDESCGFHLSYLEPGKIGSSHFHAVKDGDVVLAPRGYHPTVASPKTKNTYFWILAAFTPESRRYDLAEADPFLND